MKTKTITSTKKLLGLTAVLGLLLSGLSTQAGVISFSPSFTDDASTGISTDNTYTHTVSGGSAQTVNGVSFDLLNSTTTPANFSWSSNTGGENQVTGLLASWVPATGGVTGTETIALLTDFAFAGGPGQVSTFTLSGLTIGQLYDTRLYIRRWGSGAAPVRTIDLDFNNGAGIDSITIDEDVPTFHGYANDDNAYYLNYRFTAQATSLSIDAAEANAIDGGFHLYALTNQTAVAPTPEPSTLGLIAMGAGLLAARRRSFRSSSI